MLTGRSRTDALASILTFPFVMQEKRLALRFGASAAGHPGAWSRSIQAGELKLRELVTRTYHLDGINDALAALASGEGARGIIRW